MSLDQHYTPDFGRWLMPLPDTLAERILAETRTMPIARGALIYDVGDAPDGIYRIISGVIPAHSRDAAPLIGHLLGPGAWFGEGAALTRLPRVMSASALIETRLGFLPIDTIEDIGNEFPEFWRGLASLAATDTALAVQVARDLMITRPEDRVIAVLRRLAESLGRSAAIPLSQEQLADMCVLSRGAVSRILSRLEGAGKVRRGYREIWWLEE